MNNSTQDGKPNVSKPKEQANTAIKGAWMERGVAGFMTLALSPLFAINSAIALFRSEPILVQKRKIDALGRTAVFHHFRYGVFKPSALLLDILAAKLSFVGVSMNHTLSRSEQEQILNDYNALPGLISLYDVHQTVGLECLSPVELLRKQLNLGAAARCLLMIKGLMGLAVYRASDLTTPKIANLFELPINNVSMSHAVDWSVAGRSLVKPNQYYQAPQLGFFINAHSVNLAEANPLFKSCLRHANALFADGSGMRVAAKSIGVKLQSNINGTDMLPKICEKAAKQGKSIFLLGGQPDRADIAAKALQKRYPDLVIAGTQHGFFSFEDEAENQNIVARINASKADIVLVGLGSPNQEFWCQKHISQLNCTSVLAVGGLFDYFSGAIPRAPMIFRELGLEWIWRLRQEPIVKFKRYILGTPEFLIRTFLLKRV